MKRCFDSFIVTVVSLGTLSGVLLNGSTAYAGCGFLDITCSPSEWTEPIGGSSWRNDDEGADGGPYMNGTTSGSSVEIINSTGNEIAFSFRGTTYYLENGFSMTLNAGTSSTVTIAWDYSYEPGYQPQQVVFERETMDDWYEFQFNGYGITLY
ncbi:hypothetical protein H6G00_22415 [Leptolyngbya sp. FACHB-541]|uniref:hypothetical protein n=1 Tax=Leptolyngbya sp. FACHB-541 TaxID=2692810 RepID=UPI001685116A|nr:hypothetical protein [Leptolyngbya sp. FACHB-541]MBD1999332.1 hypothetical protein [Leptolyngbya sp. FACHB-541]